MVDLSSYISGWKARIAAEEAEDARREARLTELARRVTPLLLDRGAKQVILFGSVAEGLTHPGSDIDLAVVGMPREALEAARQAVEEALASHRVAFDLVRREDVGRAVAHAIESGTVLGER